jgi:hypothetical protein
LRARASGRLANVAGSLSQNTTPTESQSRSCLVCVPHCAGRHASCSVTGTMRIKQCATMTLTPATMAALDRRVAELREQGLYVSRSSVAEQLFHIALAQLYAGGGRAGG